MGTPISYYFPDTPTELQLPPKSIALVETWFALDDNYSHMLEEIACALATQKDVP